MSKNKNIWNSIMVKSPKRSKFDLTHDLKMSCNMGELRPICRLEVLPGDVFNISNQNLIRFAPLVATVMHRFDVTTHYFFCPNRILWKDKWDSFITNQPDAEGHPTIRLNGGIIDAMNSRQIKLFNDMGIPTLGAPDATDVQYDINAFPFAAYNKIWNEYYRDENLQTKLIDTLNSSHFNDPEQYSIQLRAWEHDYFTSALPFAQKGTAVNIPIAGAVGDVPVYRNQNTGLTTDIATTGSGGSPLVVAGRPAVDGQYTNAADALFAHTDHLNIAAGTINDLRRANALQKWLEKAARGGTRLTEVLRNFFDVYPEDSRLQRPEYICGSKSPVMISEVLNNTGTTDLPQGNMSGHGMAVTSGNNGYYKAKEHGWIIGIMSVTPKPAYQQGIAKCFFKTDFLDYAWPEFAQIGEQIVQNKEIMAWPNVVTPDVEGTFGYVPRYSELKYEPNRVSGDFQTTLKQWAAARIFDPTTPPALNDDFIKCDSTSINDNIFAVTGSTTDHLYCQIVNNVQVVRCLPFYGTPTI